MSPELGDSTLLLFKCVVVRAARARGEGEDIPALSHSSGKYHCVHSRRSWGLTGEQNWIPPCPPWSLQASERESPSADNDTNTCEIASKVNTVKKKFAGAVRACNGVWWQAKDGFTEEVLIELKSESRTRQKGKSSPGLGSSRCRGPVVGLATSPAKTLQWPSNLHQPVPHATVPFSLRQLCEGTPTDPP